MKATCPKCGSKDYDTMDADFVLDEGCGVHYLVCESCGAEYVVKFNIEIIDVELEDGQ